MLSTSALPSEMFTPTPATVSAGNRTFGSTAPKSSVAYPSSTGTTVASCAPMRMCRSLCTNVLNAIGAPTTTATTRRASACSACLTVGTPRRISAALTRWLRASGPCLRPW